MNKIIKTDRLILRRARHDDFPALTKMLQDPEVMYSSQTGPMDDEQAHEFTNSILLLSGYDDFGFWVIATKDERRVVGYCGLSMQKTCCGDNLALTYRLSPITWGKGYASEVAKALCDYALNECGVDCIVALIDRENFASIKVAEKAGLTFSLRAFSNGQPRYVYKIENRRVKFSFAKTNSSFFSKLRFKSSFFKKSLLK